MLRCLSGRSNWAMIPNRSLDSWTERAAFTAPPDGSGPAPSRGVDTAMLPVALEHSPDPKVQILTLGENRYLPGASAAAGARLTADIQADKPGRQG